jgi:CO dehydrogenase maturation factor
MATTIAISGKGGAGKTTLAAMIIKLLCSQSQDAILAVDADPNACLGQMLGVPPEDTIAEIREQTRQKQPGGEGTDRLRSLEYSIQQAITEAAGFDLLTMGRPEGPSCYCAVNNMLRTFLDKLSLQYQYVIIDNEAGMEHLSRRTTNNVDLLCIVAEPTAVGDLTARRIFELAKQLPISVKEIGVIWNRTESSKKVDEIETFGHIPDDKTIFDASMQGKTIFDLEENSTALSAVRKILESKLNRSFQLTKNQN